MIRYNSIIAPSPSHRILIASFSESQIYAGLGVVALMGSSLGTWVRKFVPREVHTRAQLRLSLLTVLTNFEGDFVWLVLARVGRVCHAFARLRQQQCS
jgi:hypothetical protein